MISKEEAEARVARGAAHLDHVRPGWFYEIDEGVLKLDNCNRCIVGQLAGDFYSASSRDDLGLADGTVYLLGFALLPEPGELFARGWSHLQDAWIKAIAARRFPVPTIEQPGSAPAVREEPDEPIVPLREESSS